MFGPAGFMQAPNTHSMRPQSREPLQPWEEIRLGQVWASANAKGVATIEVLPDIGGAVGLRHANGRLTHKRVDRFLKQYALVHDPEAMTP